MMLHKFESNEANELITSTDWHTKHTAVANILYHIIQYVNYNVITELLGATACSTLHVGGAVQTHS